MRQGEEWDFIVKSKKKMLLNIDKNMRAIQTKDLKLASVQRTFDTILEKKATVEERDVREFLSRSDKLHI